MIDDLHLTLLVENTVKRGKLLAEHGLSIWIEGGSRRFLWDTGQGFALRHNANVLGIDLATADGIALSHGHYDHTVGLKHLPERAEPYPLWAHPAAFDPKFQEKEGRSTETSDAITDRGSEHLPAHLKFRPTESRTELAPGLWATGAISRRHAIEDTGGRFFLDAELTREDPIVDDQSMVARTPGGWVVVLGCCHAGLINTLEHIHAWDPTVPFHAVLGGMHLLKATTERLDWTVEQLRGWQIPILVPMHCTGDTARRTLWRAFPDACRDCAVGDVFDFSLR